MSEDSSNSDLAKRKLQAEAYKLEQEAKFVGLTYELEKRKSVWSALTVLLGLAGILGTFAAQMVQIRENAAAGAAGDRRHADDVFNAVAKQVGDASPQVRLSAVVALSSYRTDILHARQARILLLNSVGLEHEPSIRSAILTLVTARPDGDLLAALAQQNRTFQSNVASDLHISQNALLSTAFDVEAIDSEVRSRNDSVLRTDVANLKWSISALRTTINGLRTVRDADLHDVMLGFYSVTAKPKDNSMGVARGSNHDDPAFDKNLVFEHTSFYHASLADVYFFKATFHSVNLDGSILAGTLFDRCTLDDSTSIYLFSTYETVLLPGANRTTVADGAVWAGSELEVTRFWPYFFPWRSVVVLPGNASRFFRFVDSRWTIWFDDSALLKRINLPPEYDQRGRADRIFDPPDSLIIFPR